MMHQDSLEPAAIRFMHFCHYQVFHSFTVIPTIDSTTRVWNIMVLKWLLGI